MWRLCQYRNALGTTSRSLRSRCYDQRRLLSVPAKSYDAAVIGGGITGLTTAFRLSRDPNCTKVTLYERSNRLGGWLQSETINVEGGEIVFEYGPRTLRTAVPTCLPLLDLVRQTRNHVRLGCELDSDICSSAFRA